MFFIPEKIENGTYISYYFHFILNNDTNKQNINYTFPHSTQKDNGNRENVVWEKYVLTYLHKQIINKNSRILINCLCK